MTRGRASEYMWFAVLAVVLAGMVWLNRREGVDELRLGLACAIGLVGLAYLWRGRRGFWQPPLAIVLTCMALVVLQSTSPDAVSPQFETFIGSFFGYGLAAFLAWIWVRLILPRLDAKFQAKAVMAFSAALSGALVITAFSIWMTAVNINSWHSLPVIDSAEAFEAQMAQPWGRRANGVLVTGTLADRLSRGEAWDGLDKFVAYYNGLKRTGGRTQRADGPEWFPLFLDVELADGTRLESRGIVRFHGAANWPRCGPRLHQHCLQVGDTVVIHAEPNWTVAQSDGARRPSLHDVRAVVYGDIAEARATYIAPAIGNARAFGWVALALVPFGLLPGIIGIRCGLRLRRHGSDRPGGATVTWSS